MAGGLLELQGATVTLSGTVVGLEAGPGLPTVLEVMQFWIGDDS
jgi:hypothetical protein